VRVQIESRGLSSQQPQRLIRKFVKADPLASLFNAKHAEAERYGAASPGRELSEAAAVMMTVLPP
jgi:hypothetical protein